MKHKVLINRRKEPRKLLHSDVEFILNADIIKACSLDISEKGIRLDTDIPLNIDMRIQYDDKKEERQAKLCWVRQKNNGGFILGFEFID